jgi:DNA-binding PadR family transcriptional regulator
LECRAGLTASILQSVDGLNALNTTAACVLGLLVLGPAPGRGPGVEPGAMTGWEIYETASDSLARFWSVTRSQVYLELGRLAEAGLVEQSGGGGPRSRRPYRITEAGRAVFRAWLAGWAAEEPRDDHLRSPLLLTIFFGGSLPHATLRRTLEEYRLRYARRLEAMQRMSGFIGEADRRVPPTQVLRRGIAYAEMMARWLDGVIEDLERE